MRRWCVTPPVSLFRPPGPSRSKRPPRASAAPAAVAVLAGGRLTVEDAYAYAKFGAAGPRPPTTSTSAPARSRRRRRVSWGLRSPAPDPSTAAPLPTPTLTAAPTVLLAGFEPEEESPIVFLRLRAAARDKGQQVIGVAVMKSPGLAKCSGSLITAAPGAEAGVLGSLPAEVLEALGKPGAVIIVGERLATSPGALTAAVTLAASTGARLAWIPRRAGDRGALKQVSFRPCCPGDVPSVTLQRTPRSVPSGAPTHCRAPPAGTPRRSSLRPPPARSTRSSWPASTSTTWPTPDRGPRGAQRGRFRRRHRTSALRGDRAGRRGLPVAAVAEKAGTYLDWEGRARSFERVMPDTLAQADVRVINQLASAIGVELGLQTVEAGPRRNRRLPRYAGTKAAALSVLPSSSPVPEPGEALLASWHWLLDEGTLQTPNRILPAPVAAPRVHLSATTAAEIGASDGCACSGVDLGRCRHPAADHR